MKKNNLYKNFIFLFFLLCSGVNALGLEGNFIQGGLVFGKLEQDGKIFFDDKIIPVDEYGNFLLGFKRKHKNQSIVKVIYDSGKILTKNINISERNYKIQKIDNLDKNKVTPPKSYYDRIKREIALVKKSKKIFSNFSYYKAGFVMPVEGIITGVYGSQRILNGKPRRPHYGIDFHAPEGTPVKAMMDGVVTLVENDMYFTGGTIIFDHGHGISTLYMHMKDINVEKGQKIKKGDIVGTLGQSGRATGPHLDIRLNWFEIKLDPASILN